MKTAAELFSDAEPRLRPQAWRIFAPDQTGTRRLEARQENVKLEQTRKFFVSKEMFFCEMELRGLEKESRKDREKAGKARYRIVSQYGCKAENRKELCGSGDSVACMFKHFCSLGGACKEEKK